MSEIAPPAPLAGDSGDGRPVEARGAGSAPCDFCGITFSRKRHNQRFCSEAHRRAFEGMLHKVLAACAPAVRGMVREILGARRG